MLSQMGSITNSLSPTTQNDILGILQREQDHAMSLLSLLSSLFISHANQVVALESASATPSPDSEEWKTLQAIVAALREGRMANSNQRIARWRESWKLPQLLRKRPAPLLRHQG